MTCISTDSGPRWVGMYRGEILKTDEDEPRSEHLGRLKILIPLIHGQNATAEQLPWAYPSFVSNGFIDIPEVGWTVNVFFEGGDINAPVWFGGWFPKKEFPSKAKYSNKYAYPKVKMWRAPGGQMIRMVSDELVEIYAGRDDTVTRNPETGEEQREKGEHGEWDTYIKMDLKRHKMTVKSKYPLTVQSDAKIKVKGTDVEVTACVESDNSGNPISNVNGSDSDGTPVYSNHRGSKLTLRCVDSTGKTAGELGLGDSKTGFQETQNTDGSSSISPMSVSSMIRMTPSEIRASARKVRGFKDR